MTVPAKKNTDLKDFLGDFRDGKYHLKFDPNFELRQDRLRMLQKMPFWGQLILGLQPVVVNPDNMFITTAATDGKRIYYNPVFMHLMGPEHRLFVHYHEIMHCVVNTIGRMGHRDPKLWNAASDYVINQILRDNGIKLPTQNELDKAIRGLKDEFGASEEEIEAYLAKRKLPKDYDGDKPFVLQHDDFKGKCAEEVYELLKEQEDELDKQEKEWAKQNKKDCTCGEGGDKQKDKGKKDKGDQSGDDGDEDGDGKGKGQQGNGGNQPGGQGGHSHSDDGDHECDHGGGDQDGDDDGDGEGSGNCPVHGKGGFDRAGKRKYGIGSLDQHPLDDMSKEELDEIRQDMQGRINEARAMHRGNMPAGLERMFDQMNNPKIKWSDIMTAMLMDFKDADYTWERPDPFFFGQGMSLPGIIYENTIRVAFIVDTSGSIGEADMRKAAGELHAITRQFDNYKLFLTCFDTKLYDVVEYTEENGHMIQRHPYKGGGGTHFGEAFDWIQENKDEFDYVIFFTDGYGDGWYEHMSEGVNMIWLITESWGGNAPQPTWGRVINYDRYE